MNGHPNDVHLQKIWCDFFTLLLNAPHADHYRSLIVDAKGLVPVAEAQRIHNDNEQVGLVARDATTAINSTLSRTYLF
jgi:hypothetical protein